MSEVIYGVLLGAGWFGWLQWLRTESLRKWWQDQAEQWQSDYAKLLSKFPTSAAQQEERTNG